MTKTSPLNSRRSAFGQALIPLALLALVALVGGLVYHARTLEASHRATAESALRDYAALAAWQYTQRAENYVSSTAYLTMNVVHKHFGRLDSAQPLSSPDTLVKFGDANACGLGSSARFAFRLDLPSRHLVLAKGGTPPDSAVRAAIAARFAALAGSQPLAHETVRMFLDTVGGAPRAIAYGIVRGADSIPRAVYGVESDPSALVSYLRGIPTEKPLLPPSLVRGRPMDSLLMVQVMRADGGVLATIGSASDEKIWAKETANAQAGNLVTRVVMRPEAASLLLIGGVPSSRLNTLLLLLAGSIVLAAIALLQIRRGRELSRLRTQFVASVSHELRTPLAQISMFSETLLLGRERSSDEGREFLSIIFREARRLSHLVESVLRFSRAEAGATGADPRELRLEERDVAREVSDAVRAFSPLAAAAGVELRPELEDGVIARVEPDALRQVVLNLLDNAVKFGPQGQTVTVGVARDGSEVVISVADQGRGIPASERGHVFEPFAQIANSRSRTTTGAGIGLSVVADLVAAHGGRVWIDDNTAGRGTRVSIGLPAIEGVRAPDVPMIPEHAEAGEVLTSR
jgi:signal transduction histidine kinase